MNPSDVKVVGTSPDSMTITWKVNLFSFIFHVLLYNIVLILSQTFFLCLVIGTHRIGVKRSGFTIQGELETERCGAALDVTHAGQYLTIRGDRNAHVRTLRGYGTGGQ